MLRQKFNDQWELSDGVGGLEASFNGGKGQEIVNFPHDFMIHQEKDKNSTNGRNTGFYNGGCKTYTKKFIAPLDWELKKVLIEFEGVYMNATVSINGNFITNQPYGYTNFYADVTRYLKLGEENILKVIVRNEAAPNSRWYSGSGIYRNVNVLTGDSLHIVQDGVKIRTPYIDEKLANVAINTEVTHIGLGEKKVYVCTLLKDEDGNIVGEDKTPITILSGETLNVRQIICVKKPKLWSCETPSLYTCITKLKLDGNVVDEDENSFGIRSIQFDREYGFRLNGQPTKLRGGCIHHDNGIIGAATFERAEERRMELHKKAGFNAIRSAHNPASKALLNACDRLGILVIEETFDMWNCSKNAYDYGIYFKEWWQRDTHAMIDKDYNHPCVIMYSVGNEIIERDGSSDGAGWARRQAEYVRSLDNTRPVTSALTGILPTPGEFAGIMANLSPEEFLGDDLLDNIDVAMADRFAPMTEEYAAAFEVIGYNYLHDQYESNGDLFSNRIIFGTESKAREIDQVWKKVKELDYVIGDFCWTSWDYIGEAGIGKIEYSDIPKPVFSFGEYPWYLAYCGDFDICGHRRPQSYYREIVWGLRSKPYIAVGDPRHYGQKPLVSPWSWRDVQESWTWIGQEGKPTHVEVYSDAEEVELLLNGKSIGKQPAGEENRFIANFETNYENGELIVIAYTNGIETGRMSLYTAGEAKKVKLESECMELKADGADLAYVNISFSDDQGNFVPNFNKKVKISIEGEGTLQGFGSGDPATVENFFDTTRAPFQGRLLAIIRTTKNAGEIKIKAECEGFDTEVLMLKSK